MSPVNPAILADFAEALGLNPRSKPLTFHQAKKVVDKLYKPKKRGKQCPRPRQHNTA